MKLRSSRPSRRASLLGWLRLVRLPNLLTVPGDPLAGYLLATASTAAWSPALGQVIAVSLLLYIAGLIMNDLADVHLDAQERPERPLPSGLLDEGLARLAMMSCLALALLLARYIGWATTVVALALLVTLTLYNHFFKRTVLGPLFMGVCRGMNVWLGVSLVPDRTDVLYVAAGGITAYIVAVTVVAREEMTGRRLGVRALLPLLVVAGLVAALLTHTTVGGATLFRLGAVLFLGFSVTGLAAWRLWGAGPRTAAPFVGLLISVQMFLQAAGCLAADAGPLALAVALALLLAWPLNRLLARAFAAS
jgi:4-hydroxybenzoate polyprenyltransferase